MGIPITRRAQVARFKCPNNVASCFPYELWALQKKRKSGNRKCKLCTCKVQILL